VKTALSRLWARLPVLVRAIVVGSIAAAAGTLPWAALAAANARHWTAVPWCVPLAAVFLWLYWRYVRGAGWPRSTAAWRRANCRAHRLSDETWGAALVAGVLGLIALVLTFRVLNRLVTLPAQRTDDVAHVPLQTLAPMLIMGALVAGITEEASFRGYMQGPIERRHGPIIAILVTGSLFAFVHFSHAEVTLGLMPFFLSVAVIYGMLAYLTNSILPGVVLHAGGNILAAIGLFAGGQSEWQTSPTPAPLVWESGADASFWLSAIAASFAVAAAVWAYRMLARTTRAAPQPTLSS
jgi:membrane protease YdiL (CAAX protease family)